MFEVYLGLFAACVFSSGYLVGAVMGANGAEKRAITRISLAESRADEWEHTAWKNHEKGRHLKEQITVVSAANLRLTKELATRPHPRKRDANGRFVK